MPYSSASRAFAGKELKAAVSGCMADQRQFARKRSRSPKILA
jgi:hypothetical protein